MTTVPFLDLGAATAELRDEIGAAVTRTLDSGWYILGEEVRAFEREFAAYTEAAHCVGVGNGLDALQLALRALDIGPGDEVLVPSNTFVATWLAVSYVGATPVPVEPDPRSYNLDPARLAAALTPATRAVIPVHLYGQPADLEPILAFAQEHDLRVIEDAAQAQGARYRGRRIGAAADAVCWSFYPGKNLGALGDGGAITTDDPELAQRMARLANYGSSRKYVHDEKGVNSRLDEIQAAVLRVKLAHLDDWNARRRAVAARYLEGLQGVPLTLPHVPEWAEPVWHLFVVRSPERERIRAELEAAGVQTLIHYPIAPHLQGAYADAGIGAGSLPIAEAMQREVFSLPIGPHLSDAQQQRVLDAVRAAVIVSPRAPATG